MNNIPVFHTSSFHITGSSSGHFYISCFTAIVLIGHGSCWKDVFNKISAGEKFRDIMYFNTDICYFFKIKITNCIYHFLEVNGRGGLPL